MKKKIYLLLTLLIALFVFSGRVEAAKELTCIYKKDAVSKLKMFVQDSKGNITLYVADSGDEKVNNPGWYNPFENSSIKLEVNLNDTVYKEDNSLTKCPEFTTKFKSTNDSVIYFRDKAKFFSNEQKLINSYDGIPDSIGNNDSYIDEGLDIEDTEWEKKCVYCNGEGCLYLYYNDEKFDIDNKRKKIENFNPNFDMSLLRLYSEKGCPAYIYEYYVETSNTLGIVNKLPASYSFAKPQLGLITPNVPITECNDTGTWCTITTHNLIKIDLNENFSDYHKNEDIGNENDDEIYDCSDLLGPELLDVINKIMNTIKLIVPIILIAMGVLDFTKAVFSGKEEQMTKSRQMFFRRIIAAIIVFLVPIFVNFILSIANEVWDYINPNTCIND